MGGGVETEDVDGGSSSAFIVERPVYLLDETTTAIRFLLCATAAILNQTVLESETKLLSREKRREIKTFERKRARLTRKEVILQTYNNVEFHSQLPLWLKEAFVALRRLKQ